MNPGPGTQSYCNASESNDSSFPCLLCKESVNWSADALQCDGCDNWLHRECIRMSNDEYERLAGLTATWLCCHCGLMNISTDLFIKSTLNLDNKFNELSDSSSEFPSLDAATWVPIQSSSPKSKPMQKGKRGKKYPKKRSITILNVNCQSLHAKREPFHLMVNRIKPDLVIGTESWLKEGDTDASVFPTTDCEILRKDRKTDAHGGVFIMARKDLILVREEKLETNCELLWGRLNLYGSKMLHLCAYYRPKESDEESLLELENSLAKLRSKHENVIIAGDFNLPGWDWKNNLVKSDCNYRSLHYKFGEILDNNSLQQLVEEPTRGKNTLDLFATNAPSKIIKVEVLPGISDHDIVAIEVDISPKRRKQKPRKIHLYSKAQWSEFEEKVNELADELLSKFESNSVDDLWETFKGTLHSLIEKIVPCKSAKSKDMLPYITPEINRLIKKRDRLFKKRRQAQRNFENSTLYYKNLERKHKELKATIQRKLRQAYWSHIEDVITPLEEENKYVGLKRFWGFIKRVKKDYESVSSLKNDGKIITEAEEKANLLNRQFESVFTKENPIPTQLLSDSKYSQMPEINFTTQGIQKLLEGLKKHKAPGPDKISPKGLKTTCKKYCPNINTYIQEVI